MTITLVFDVALVALLLFRQRRVRRVARHLRLFGPVVLGLIGLYQLSAFTDHHRLTGAVTTALLGAIVVGAVALGAARGATVALWRLEGVVLRQATWLTMGLWAVSLALYAAVAGWIGSLDAVAGVAWSALLVFVGLTLGIQAAVVHRRARSLLRAAGPFDTGPGPETITARWWAAAWGEGPPPGPDTHPDAIEARAEPIEPGHPGPDDQGEAS
ncbi:MAG: hypothetical protein ACLP9C_08770 [Acidimicrobiales bacterium]